MGDERLRLVAEVADQFTGPLDKLQTALGRTARAGAQTGKDMKKDFDGFHGSIGKATGAIQGMLSPLQSLGVVGLGAGLGLSGIATALRGFSSGTQQLSILSKETGLAVNELRAFGALGERFGVSADTMQGGVKRFSDEMSRLQRRFGEAYSGLQAMNLGELVEKLVAAPNMKAALDDAMDTLSKIGDPVRRRKVAEMLFGADQIGAVAGQVTGKYREMMTEIQKSIGSMSKETEQAAIDFEKNVSRMGNAAERLKLNVLGPLLKGLNTIVESGDKAGLGANAEAMDKDLQSRLGDATKRRDALNADPTKNADEIKSLEKEIRNLTDAIKRSKDGAGPSGVSAIPMSYSGGAGNGAPRIYNASFGGGGMGGMGSPGLGGFGGPLPTMGGGYGAGGGSAGGGGSSRGLGRGVIGGSPSTPTPSQPSEGGSPFGAPMTPGDRGIRSAPGISARDMHNINPEIAAYIRNSAARHGIDPNVALRIANSEGLRGSTPTHMTPGDKGTSFGPFQLHYKSRVPGLTLGGLGDAYTRETGHRASDAQHWKEQIDFAMKNARKSGWGAWHGRIGARVGVWDGIGTYNGPVPSPDAAQVADSSAPEEVGGATARGLDGQVGTDVGNGTMRMPNGRIRSKTYGSGPGPSSGTPGASGRMGDQMMQRFYGGEAPTMKPGKGSLDITLHGFTAGAKPRASMNDLFKDVNVSKKRQMETTSI